MRDCPCREVSASPGGHPQAVLFGSRLAVIPASQAHLPSSLHTPSTIRRGRQLSSINRLQQPSSTCAFLTKPSLPTTIHSTLPLAPASSFFGTRTLELSFRLASSPVHLHANASSIPCLDVQSRSYCSCKPYPTQFDSCLRLDLSPESTALHPLHILTADEPSLALFNLSESTHRWRLFAPCTLTDLL